MSTSSTAHPSDRANDSARTVPSHSRGDSTVAPLNLVQIQAVEEPPPPAADARGGNGSSSTIHEEAHHHHIQAQDASSAIQQLLGVDEVDMLHRIFMMEGLVPVMTSGGDGGGGKTPSPTSARGSAAGASFSSAVPSAAATTTSCGIDAAAAGTLCLTVTRFIEALAFVATFRRYPTATSSKANHRPQHSPMSPLLNGSSCVEPQPAAPLHLPALLQQQDTVVTTAAARHGNVPTHSSAVVSALCADNPQSRALLHEVVATWTMQLATQVEGVRARREDHRALSVGTFGAANPSLFTPPSSAGSARLEREPAPAVQEVDLAALFPSANSPTRRSHLPSGSGGASAAFAHGQPKLVVKWADFTSSFIRDAEHKDAVEDQASDLQRLVKNVVRCPTAQLHMCSASISIQTTRGESKKLITGGSDGLVKVWAASTNAYEGTISNNGSAWVVGLALLQPHENYLVIATSNGQLTVVEFPGGAVVQKYIGCVSIVSAVAEVNVLSVLHTKKYGMSPGESGPRQVRFSNVAELSQEAFTEKRRMARGGPLNRSVAVKPIVGGFVNPTTLQYIPERGLSFFGTIDGNVGCFDISEDLRQTTLITGSTVKAIHVSYSTAAHLDAVTCIRYAARPALLLTAGMDGCIYKISMEGAGMKWVAHAVPQRHNTQETSSRPVVGMEWSEPLQLLVSYTSDRAIKFWSLMRSEPLHVMDPLPHDIRSVTFLGTDRLGVLTADKTIYVYDLRAFRLLQTMVQSISGESSGTVLDVYSATIMRSSGDLGGCLSYVPDREALLCCLRSPIQYAPASVVAQSAASSSAAIISPKSSRNIKQPPPSSDPTASSAEKAKLAYTPQVPRHALPRHPMRILGLAFQRHTRTLYSIDGHHLFLWSMATGECTAWSQVSRQVRKVSCPPHLSGKSLQLTACTWAGAEAVRLVTGTHLGAILTWSPSGTGVLAMDALGAPGGSSTDVSCCATSGSNVLVAIGNKAHLVTYDTSMVLADGNRRSTVRTLTLDGPSSIMSVCFLRETALVAIGTVDAVLHVCNLDTMTVLETQRLKDREGRDEVSSVESIVLLQRRKQNVALLLLEDGAVNVYHLGKRAVVFHARLFKKHEARFHAACVSLHEDRLYVGDSLGRLFVYDIGSITSATDYRITASSLAKPCIKYLFNIQATLDGLTTMACLDVGAIGLGSAVAGGTTATASSFAVSTPLPSTGGLTPSPLHLASPTTVDALVIGCANGLIRCFAVSHSEAIHVGTLGDPVCGRWDWADPATYAAEELPKMEKDAVDEASEAFLDDILREAKRRSDAVDDEVVAPVVVGGEMPLTITDGASEHCAADTQRSCRTVDELESMAGHRAQNNGSPPARRQQTNASGILPSLPASSVHQLRASAAALLGGTLTLAPSTDAHPALGSSTKEGGSGIPNPPPSLSPRRALTQAAESQGGPIPKPPRQGLSEPLLVSSLHVKKRFIKPPDIDLGNGMHITDHATEKKLQELEQQQQLHNSAKVTNGSMTPRSEAIIARKNPQRGASGSIDAPAACSLPPPSVSVRGASQPTTGAAADEPLSTPETPQTFSEQENHFFITSLGLSMEAQVVLQVDDCGGMRGMVLPTQQKRMSDCQRVKVPHHQAPQQQQVGVTSDATPQSIDGLSPLSPGVGGFLGTTPGKRLSVGLGTSYSVQSNRSLAMERTLCPAHTVNLFETSTNNLGRSEEDTDDLLQDGRLTNGSGILVEARQNEPVKLSSEETLPGEPLAKEGPPPRPQRRTSRALRRRSMADTIQNAAYGSGIFQPTVGSSILIAVPSAHGGAASLVPLGDGSLSDEDSARHHTRALLQQMAHRLDRVRPRGSQEGRFGRRVERLYETAEQKKGRQLRRRQRQQQSSDNEHRRLVGASSDDETLRVMEKEGGSLPSDGREEANGSPSRDEDDDDGEEEDDDEGILASLRSPQSAKNMLAVEEKLRSYRKARETGPAAPPAAPSGAASPGKQVVRGGLPRGDPAWLTRVSSQLVMQDVTFTIPSTLSRTLAATSPRGGGAQANLQPSNGAGVPISSSSGTADAHGSLQRGISMFGFQAPAPPNSAPGTSRKDAASRRRSSLVAPQAKTSR